MPQTTTITNNGSFRNVNNRAQRHPKMWWLEHYQAWRDSGQTKIGYCTAHGIKLSSFYNWVCRFQKNSSANSLAKTGKTVSPFIEVAVCPTSLARARSLTVGDITVGFDEALSASDIAQWAKSLRAWSIYTQKN